MYPFRLVKQSKKRTDHFRIWLFGQSRPPFSPPPIFCQGCSTHESWSRAIYQVLGTFGKPPPAGRSNPRARGRRIGEAFGATEMSTLKHLQRGGEVIQLYRRCVSLGVV